MSVPTDLAYFAVSEFSHPEVMDAAFCRWLDQVRAVAGVPMVITNAGRIAAATEPIGSAGSKSLHRRGRAVDLRSCDWTAAQKWKLMAAIANLASAAPGHVELELVHSATDQHWHLGVDDTPTAQHEVIEAEE